MKIVKRILILTVIVCMFLSTNIVAFGATHFSDVSDSSKYYYKPVYWAVEQKIANGYSDGTFKPQKDCTRKDLIVFLWRLAGRPKTTGNVKFSDVKYSKSSDSYKAILWGSNKGIVKGFSADKFKPDLAVNRKDAMIMLYRFAKKPSVKGNMKFSDCKKYSSSSDTYKAIIWGTNSGITKGYSNGTFKPESKCLREHIVTFIYRYKHPTAVKLTNTSTNTKSSGTKSNSSSTKSSSKVSNYTGTVYWTRDGGKYHYSRNCRTLARSKNVYSGTIEQSGKKDLCSVCGY